MKLSTDYNRGTDFRGAINLHNSLVWLQNDKYVSLQILYDAVQNSPSLTKLVVLYFRALSMKQIIAQYARFTVHGRQNATSMYRSTRPNLWATIP